MCIMYHIKSIQLDTEGTVAFFLVSENDRDFLTGWKEKKQTKEVGANFIRLLININRHGYDWAFSSSKLKHLDGNLGLVEIKGFRGIWRVLSYLHESDQKQMVMLREFRGHQGSDKVPASLLEECRRLAEVAKRLIERELDNGDDTRQ